MPGQPPTPQQQQPHPMQQHAQNAQAMLHNGQLGSMPSAPPMPMQLQNLSQQQQQQLGSALNIFNTAVTAQARPPAGPPPPMPEINTQDFPFDWRLLPQIQHVHNPEWKGMMMQRNPTGYQMVVRAAEMLQSGAVKPDVMNRMNQMMAWSKAMAGWHQQQAAWQAGQMGQGQPPGARPAHLPPHVQQQLAQQGLPGYARPPMGATPPQQWQGPPGGPPRPPLAPASSHESAPRKSSASKKEPKGSAPPQPSSMAPPHWVPPPSAIPQPPHGKPSDETLPAHPPSQPLVPVEEWREHLRLDLPITEITKLPEESDDPTFGGQLPPLTEEDQKKMKKFMLADFAYAKDLEKTKKRVRDKMINWAKNSDMETPWWDLRKGEVPKRPQARLTILWPADKVSERARRSHRGRREIRL